MQRIHLVHERLSKQQGKRAAAIATIERLGQMLGQLDTTHEAGAVMEMENRVTVEVRAGVGEPGDAHATGGADDAARVELASSAAGGVAPAMLAAVATEAGNATAVSAALPGDALAGDIAW